MDPDILNNFEILSDAETFGPEFTIFLKKLNDIPDAPYIHKKAIAYCNSNDRRNWAGNLPEDPQSRSTISEFWKDPKQRKKVWLGCFITTTETTVQPNWNKLVWHVWGVAVIKAMENQGKHIIYY